MPWTSVGAGKAAAVAAGVEVPTTGELGPAAATRGRATAILGPVAAAALGVEVPTAGGVGLWRTRGR